MKKTEQYKTESKGNNTKISFHIGPITEIIK